MLTNRAQTLIGLGFLLPVRQTSRRSGSGRRFAWAWGQRGRT